jgi:hypothetical protein
VYHRLAVTGEPIDRWQEGGLSSPAADTESRASSGSSPSDQPAVNGLVELPLPRGSLVTWVSGIVRALLWTRNLGESTDTVVIRQRHAWSLEPLSVGAASVYLALLAWSPIP